MKIMFRRIFFLTVLPFLITGCIKEIDNTVDCVNVIQGDEQYAPPNTECKEELKFELLSPEFPGMFGGNGERKPVSGIKVLFKPLNNSDISVIPISEVSDAGGRISARIKTGTKIGDQYLKIIPQGFPKASKTVRVISGISVEGDEQEAYVKRYLPKPIRIKVFNAKDMPEKGVPVYFSVSSSPEPKSQAACEPAQVFTDEEGIAETAFKVGGKTGQYQIFAEVADTDRKLNIRGIKITEMGLDLFGLTGLIVSVLGGVALFIFGMTLMSDGLQLVAGDRMKNILQFFASNHLIAIGAGTLVTSIIQSSSACSVMVVGFVNAGLLTLRQAIGILLGANIGTTVTAQMISFHLGCLAFPSIIIGLLMILVSKRTATKGWGQTLLGFGVLFYGMNLMADELKLIGDFPTFINFFRYFDCTPVDGKMPLKSVLGAIGIGTGMTLIIQSSSATIGIALALAGSGLLNFYTAIPVILGDNIGTTITAILASISTNKLAKQAALSNVFIKTFGTLYMVFIFYIPYPGTQIPVFMYLIDFITSGNVFAPAPENIVRHIAMAHTVFNIFNAAVFLPLFGILEKLCGWVIRIKEEEVIKVKYLEPHLLNTPSIALEQTIQSIRYMVKESWAMITHAMDNSFMLAKTDKDMIRNLEERENKIDELQEAVTDYLVQLTTRRLTEPQAEIIPLLMHCTNDAERIADHTENIIGLAKRIETAEHKLTGKASEEIKELWGILADQAKHVISSLHNTDRRDVNCAVKDEIEINKLTDKLEENHIARLKTGKCNVVAGIIFLEMISELEKIGDHLSNIADRAPKIQKHHLELG